MPKYLGQAVAIEADVRKRAQRDLTSTYRRLSATDPMNGLRGDYTPADEDGEELPPETKRVEVTVKEIIDEVRGILGPLYDATAARDYSNAAPAARADVVVPAGTDATVLVEGAPMPYLLWLDRQLDDIAKFVSDIPTHEAATTWDLEDPERGIYKSAAWQVARQITRPKALEAAKATDKHPAQVHLYNEQVRMGTWTRQKFTGTVPVAYKAGVLARLATLKNAIKAAREEMKRAEAVQPAVGEKVLNYLFG